MQFTNPETVQSRARAVLGLLPASVGARLTLGGTRVAVGSLDTRGAVFDALTGAVGWRDVDGELRVVHLPSGVSSEAVAAMLFGLASVDEWV